MFHLSICKDREDLKRNKKDENFMTFYINLNNLKIKSDPSNNQLQICLITKHLILIIFWDFFSGNGIIFFGMFGILGRCTNCRKKLAKH